MTDDLSIFAAARECGDAPALRVSDRTWSFGQLAEMAYRRMESLSREVYPGYPYPLTGSNTVDTVVTLYALWERGVAPLLLHPRFTEHERHALLSTAQQGGALDVTDAAAVLFTSGTTGSPRAAILARSAFAASAKANAANMGWREDDCWLLCMPLAHVGGLSILTRCLMARRCVALTSGFDAQQSPAMLEQQHVTLVSLVPTMLARLLDTAWTPPPRMRAILLGGAHASSRLLQRAFARKVPVLVTYGLTETCSQVATTPYELRYDPRAHGVGKPLPGIDVRLRDGEIEVRGSVLMDRYWTEPRLQPGAWFSTGDMGSLDADGCLHVQARRHDLIITGGENVYPVEIENALEECPGVIAAGVFGVPDELWGETVAAALVIDRAVATEARLREYIARHLAPHKQPRQLLLVEELPLTRAGKLDRTALSRLAVGRASQPILR